MPIDEENINEISNHVPLGGWEINYKLVISKHIWKIDIFGISCEFAFRLLPQDLTDDEWILVQVIAWLNLYISCLVWCSYPSLH